MSAAAAQALDTNVLARLLLKDDPAQFSAAQALLADVALRFVVPTTVWLELAWVLEVNDAPREGIASALAALAALPNVRAAEPAVLRLALAAYANGLDFGDALHHAQCTALAALRTFDKRFVKAAKQHGLRPPVTAA